MSSLNSKDKKLEEEIASLEKKADFTYRKKEEEIESLKKKAV